MRQSLRGWMLFAAAGLSVVAVLADEPPEEAAVTVKLLDYDSLQQLIEAQRGRVVVVDCWATYCAPCIREFPRLVALHQRYGPEKLACISVSFDYQGLDRPEDSEPAVLAFLQRQRATFDNVLNTVPAEELYKRMKLPAIPAVYVYRADGTLAERFTSGEIYDRVEPLVEGLITGR